MNVLSLFSGIGGLDLGLERAGMTVVGQVEIDPWCRKVLAKHWPEVPRHDDVRTAVGWWGRRRAPDLVCGGFPCQPVSSAGKRKAQADSRWLWPAFRDVVRALQPGLVLVENVTGLLERGMGDVLRDLAAIGYDAEWDCIPAAFVGAPHIRNRVFILAYPVSERSGGLADPAARYFRDWTGTGRPEVSGRPAQRRQDVAHAAIAERRAAQPQGLAAAGRRASEPRERASGGGPVSNWWAAEPDVGRVAHGIPARVDRLRGLGNAVVPQVAEHIGRMIMEAA